MLLDIQLHILKRINKNPTEFNVPNITTDYSSEEVVKAMYDLQDRGFVKDVAHSVDNSYCSFSLTINGIRYKEFVRKEILLSLANGFVLPIIVSIIVTLITLSLKGLL